MSDRSRRFACLVGLLGVAALSGCDPADLPGSRRSGGPQSRGHHPHSMRAASEVRLPIISGSRLAGRVQHSQRPLLVEFGVDFNCYRCDQMRPGISRLAREFEGQADFVRVDFNLNRQLATQVGVTVCPSYVLFDQGRVVATRSFPTAADSLATDLRSILAVGGGDER